MTTTQNTEAPRTYAIAASDLRAGHTITGDSLCPTRYGRGSVVGAVNDDIDGRVLAIIGGRPVELLANETVYITRGTA